MPYKSKVAVERANWMTLPEIVAHICRVDWDTDTNTWTDQVGARQQIRDALADCELFPLVWEDQAPSLGSVGGTSAPTDSLPALDNDWHQADINWQTGDVRDDWGEFKHGELRTLLVHRLQVRRLWPDPRETISRAPDPITPIGAYRERAVPETRTDGDNRSLDDGYKVPAGSKVTIEGHLEVTEGGTLRVAGPANGVHQTPVDYIKWARAQAVPLPKIATEVDKRWPGKTHEELGKLIPAKEGHPASKDGMIKQGRRLRGGTN